MNPFFLGTSERRLFGIHTPAASRAGKPRAAVLCQPWGDEYIYAHRCMRQLAIRLSLCGFDTLRFDYFGAGDSAGEEGDTDAEGMRADVVTAIETLEDLAATDKVTLIGLRAGANIAADVAIRFASGMAAGCQGTIEALILWDPLRPLESDALPGRTLTLVTQALQGHELASLAPGRAAESPAAGEFLPAPCPWIEEASTTGVVPIRVIQRIEEWLR